MIKPIKWLFISVIFIGGIASILATSSEHPPMLIFHAVTQNDYADDPYGYRQAFACEGEEALLKWGNFRGAKPRLSADPVDNISPELQNEAISDNGSLPLTILGDATLSLDFSGDSDVTLEAGLIPDELCVGFAFPLVGWYQGELEQATPTSESLERQLRLYWTHDAEEPEPLLHTELAVNLNRPFRGTLRCDYRLTNPNVVCTDSQASLRLEGDVSADGLTGTYLGTTDTGVDYGGSFVMQKQVGAPPQETP